MKKISLYLSQSLLTELDRKRKQADISRNRYITDAIAFYNDYLERQALTKQFAEESELVAEDSLHVLAEFEFSSTTRNQT